MALLRVLWWNLVNLKSTMTRRLFIQKYVRKINDEELKREMAMDSIEMKMFFGKINVFLLNNKKMTPLPPEFLR